MNIASCPFSLEPQGCNQISSGRQSGRHALGETKSFDWPLHAFFRMPARLLCATCQPFPCQLPEGITKESLAKGRISILRNPDIAQIKPVGVVFP
ncbi:hypothetical protein [Chlorobium limicola]|uniref:hypothetical protein n=1 Tax=Chlorobium limicola TaxID=1092 RepID=UPI00128EEB9C|nr:hypothetical protein [Chlorobium limicola]